MINMKKLEESLIQLVNNIEVEEEKNTKNKNVKPVQRNKDLDLKYERARLSSIITLYNKELTLDINMNKEVEKDRFALMCVEIEKRTRKVPLCAMSDFFEAVRNWKFEKGYGGITSVYHYGYCADLYAKGFIHLKKMEKINGSKTIAKLPDLAEVKKVGITNEVKELAKAFVNYGYLKKDEIQYLFNTNKKLIQNKQ